MVAGKSQITPVATVMARQCCSKKCVSRFAIAAGTTARSSFDARSGQAQRQWLLSYLLDHHQQRDGYTNTYTLLVLSGFAVQHGETKFCAVCFRYWRKDLRYIAIPKVKKNHVPRKLCYTPTA